MLSLMMPLSVSSSLINDIQLGCSPPSIGLTHSTCGLRAALSFEWLLFPANKTNPLSLNVRNRDQNVVAADVILRSGIGFSHVSAEAFLRRAHPSSSSCVACPYAALDPIVEVVETLQLALRAYSTASVW